MGSMSCQPFSSNTTVQQALDAAQGTDKVFNQHRTACVGCYLARFCTLQDVARAYSLPLDPLVAELQEAALIDSSCIIGAHNEKLD